MPVLDALLANRRDDAPSGENLEYDPVFAALESAAQPGEEKQIGDQIVPAEPPDYDDVIPKAIAVLEQSHDLRAAIYLAQAELYVNGFSGFAETTGYIRGCLEQHWETCHPQLDEEDDNDPTMRVNALLGLADDATIVRAVRAAALTQSSNFGAVSLRDIDVARGELAPAADAESVLDLSAIAAAFKDTNADALMEIFSGANKALEDIKAIDAVFNERIPGQGPDLAPVIKALQRAVKRLSEETGTPADEIPADPAEQAPADPATSAAQPPMAAPGAITSPRDVETALDRIIAYYGTHEPSSPVPIVLKRAKRLVGADFMTILKDMAPGGMDNVRVVAGVEEDEDDED